MKHKLLWAYLLGLPTGVVLFWLLFYLNVLADFKILFYRGLLIISIVCIAQVLLLLLFLVRGNQKKSSGAVPHAISIAMICMAINMTFFIVLPVSLDRSVSVFLLGYMVEKNVPATRGELEKAFNDIYVVRYGAINRRIEEQIASGNLIETSPGYYKLTKNGAGFVWLSRITADVFKIDNKFVKPDINKK